MNILRALKPPGWLPQWHCGVRASASNKMLAFISAVPCTIRVIDKIRPMVEINFLCVHKKLRSKRVAPVLIREITRRVNQQGIFQELPSLSRLATDLLAVPSSSAATERLFSVCRVVLGLQRHRLNASNLEQEVIYHGNLDLIESYGATLLDLEDS